jgi:hypothetical protein
MKAKLMEVRALILIAAGALAGCVTFKAPSMSSDPNEEFRQRQEEKTEQANIDAFIIDHPELDEKMKKELRDGTMTPKEALEILRARKAADEAK